MNDILKYNNFFATVHYNSTDEVFYGKLEGINDLITFEGQSVKGLKLAMEEAVADYLELCKSIGKNPHNSFKGSFNVRINPGLDMSCTKVN